MKRFKFWKIMKSSRIHQSDSDDNYKEICTTSYPFKRKPSLYLYSLIICRKWEECNQLIDEKRSLLRTATNPQLLHLACTYHAPVNVISKLISLYPDCLLFQDANHRTPLHTAIICSSGNSAALGLPGGNYKRDIIEFLLRACPQATRLKTKQDNWIPLHTACHYTQTPLSILKLLIYVDPQTLLIENKGGVTPLQMLCQSFLQKLRIDSSEPLSLESMNFSQISARAASAGIDIENIDVFPSWDKIQFAIKHLYFYNRNSNYDYFARNLGNAQEENDMYSPLVHATAGTPSIPRDIVWFILFLHGNQLQSYNHEGLLPLHISILACGHYYSVSVANQNYFASCRSNPIDLLLRVYPQAASMPYLNQKHDGRFPLNVAIQNKISWENGLKDLFKAAPDIIKKRDVGGIFFTSSVLSTGFRGQSTGLYPFMIAATVSYEDYSVGRICNCISTTIEEDKTNIEAIYQLLRVCPELVQFYNTDVDDESKRCVLS